MINLKIMQFDKTLMKVIENAVADGVPEASIYLSLTNALNTVNTALSKKIQEEYAVSQNSAAQSGEPVVTDIQNKEEM